MTNNCQINVEQSVQMCKCKGRFLQSVLIRTKVSGTPPSCVHAIPRLGSSPHDDFVLSMSGTCTGKPPATCWLLSGKQKHFNATCTKVHLLETVVVDSFSTGKRLKTSPASWHSVFWLRTSSHQLPEACRECASSTHAPPKRQEHTPSLVLLAMAQVSCFRANSQGSSPSWCHRAGGESAKVQHPL